MNRFALPSLCFLAAALLPGTAAATASPELYTSAAYGYGRFEARLRFAAGDGVVSSFFLWKEGSEVSGTFWNELDFEKVGADCRVLTNALYGNPPGDHGEPANLSADPCGGFHVYAYEWLPDSITWFVDGVQIRKETGDAARAFADNAPNGMQVHFNVWPGDSTFGGNFNPSILPVHQYVDWAQFSSYADGAFTLAWREDFDGTAVPDGWLTGTWASPKNLSTHDPANVNFLSGYAVLSMTADDAKGPAGAMPPDDGAGGGGGSPATGGNGGGPAGGSGGSAGSADAGGTSNAGGTTGGGTAGGDAAGGTPATGGTGATGGSGGTGATTGTSGGSSGTDQGAQGGTSSGATGGAQQQAGSSATSGGTSSVAGSTGASGPNTAGTTATGDPGSGSETEEGCGCRQAGASSRGRGWSALGLVLSAGFLAARRRRILGR